MNRYSSESRGSYCRFSQLMWFYGKIVPFIFHLHLLKGFCKSKIEEVRDLESISVQLELLLIQIRDNVQNATESLREENIGRIVSFGLLLRNSVIIWHSTAAFQEIFSSMSWYICFSPVSKASFFKFKPLPKNLCLEVSSRIFYLFGMPMNICGTHDEIASERLLNGPLKWNQKRFCIYARRIGVTSFYTALEDFMGQEIVTGFYF